jgi:predicted amidophosphoribosyltransferase
MSGVDNTPESTLNNGSEDAETPRADEAYCADCGEVIKKEAEICPECGVRQKPSDTPTAQQQQSTQQATIGHRQLELEKIVNENKATGKLSDEEFERRLEKVVETEDTEVVKQNTKKG